MTDFNTLLQQARNSRSLQIPEGWGQGRATFGGLVAALAFAQMSSHIQDDRPIRSLSLSFVGTVAPGEIQLETQILRAGKGVTQVETKLFQNQEVQLVMLGSFGTARESLVRVDAESGPETKAPQQCPALPYIANVTPEFTQQLEYRWTTGAMPFMGSSSRVMGGWVRFRDCVGDVGPAHILGLVDAWPPAILPLLKKPAPASSLCWTIEFIHPQPVGSASDFWRYEASIDHAQDGYGHIAAKLWNAQGELVALSRQTVAVFA